MHVVEARWSNGRHLRPTHGQLIVKYHAKVSDPRSQLESCHCELCDLLPSVEPDQLGVVGVQLSSVHGHPPVEMCDAFGNSRGSFLDACHRNTGVYLGLHIVRIRNVNQRRTSIFWQAK